MPLFGKRKTKTDNGSEEKNEIAAMIESAIRVAPLLQEPSSRAMTRFHSDEVVVGDILAQGEFNTVFAVQQLRLSTAIDVDRDEEERRLDAAEDGELVVKMATFKNANRRNKKKSQKLHALAAATLFLEAQYLARLQHPNIINLKGIPERNRYNLFFFLTQRIVETLEERIESWRAKAPEPNVKFDTRGPLFESTMKILNSIASALSYLQKEHRIALLNLTPGTVGFLRDGSVRLFDLGHSREIPRETKAEKDKHGDEEASISAHDLSIMFGRYCPMEVSNGVSTRTDGSANTGGHLKVLPTAPMGLVPRYLAPEILTTGQYSLKSDSYSFAVIIYELLTLQKPYAAFQPGQHMIKVCIQGKRPNLHLYHFPKTLVNLLRRGWRHNWSKRISVSTMEQVLANVQFDEEKNDIVRQPPPKFRGMPPTMVTSQPRRGRRPRRNRSLLPSRQKSLTSSLSLRRNKSAQALFRRSMTPVPLARVNTKREL